MLSTDIGGSECPVLRKLPVEWSALLPTNSSSSPAEAAAPAISQGDRVDLGLGESGEHDSDQALHLPRRRPSPRRVPVAGEAPADIDRLCALIHRASTAQILNELRRAACRGLSPDAYHPDQGQPADLALTRCHGCQARLACLALALRAEDPEERCGWYGGLGPSARDVLVVSLGTDVPKTVPMTEFARAVALRSQGWTINAIADELRCSRRTVQRYLKRSAA